MISFVRPQVFRKGVTAWKVFKDFGEGERLEYYKTPTAANAPEAALLRRRECAWAWHLEPELSPRSGDSAFKPGTGWNCELLLPNWEVFGEGKRQARSIEEGSSSIKILMTCFGGYRRRDQIVNVKTKRR